MDQKFRGMQLDYFLMFRKGGIVVWCSQDPKDKEIIANVNAFVEAVLLQERTEHIPFEYGSRILQHTLDKDLELVFVAGYQKVTSGPIFKTLKTSYVDQFLENMRQNIRGRFPTNVSTKRLIASGLLIEQIYRRSLQESNLWSAETVKGHSAFTAQLMPDNAPDRSMVGPMDGNLQVIEVNEESKEKEKENERDGFLHLVNGLVSGKTFTPEDLKMFLEKLKGHLISKNVVESVAVKVCENVANTLDGKVLGQDVSSRVNTAIQDCLLQLWQPKGQVEVLSEALKAKRKNRPYVVVFCGANGVGKTFSLAKMAFWLLECELRVVLISADSFLADAEEQLKNHARNLKAFFPAKAGKDCVEIYEKGSGKEPAGLTAEAISYTKKNHYDVVLIDTTGRSPENEPLMKSLVKLLRVNDPDLVLFVGEALVGDEPEDQLVKFNQALADYAEHGNPRLIDGVILTKFDNIEDKVGVAVSTAYISGIPILYVGTGQNYTDFRPLSSRLVISALMK